MFNDSALSLSLVQGNSCTKQDHGQVYNDQNNQSGTFPVAVRAGEADLVVSL